MEEDVDCANVSASSSNHNGSYTNFSDVLIYKTIAGSLIFILLFPFILFQWKFVPIRTTCVALLGAMLMVVCGVLTKDDAYTVIGLQSNVTTILILLGMMVIGEYVEREQLMARILRRLLPPDIGFPGFLFRSCGVMFLLSLLFTGEGAAMILTPVLLKCWKEHERSRGELETLLIGIMMSANIGGASTYLGSFMLALISAKTHQSPYQHSLLDMRTCLKYLFPPAVVCFWINYALLIIHFQVRSRRLPACVGGCDTRRSEQEPFSIAGSSGTDLPQLRGNGWTRRDQNDDLSYDMYAFREDRLAHPPTLETIIEDEVLELPESTAWGLEYGSATPQDVNGEIVSNEAGDDDSAVTSRLRSCTGSEDLTNLDVEYMSELPGSQHSSPNNSIPSNVPPTNAAACNRTADYMNVHGPTSRGNHSAFSMAEFFGARLQPFDQQSTCGSVVVQVTLAVAIMAVVALLLASNSFVRFDPGLISIAGAFMLIIIDSAVNRFATSFILRRIDWSIVVIFSAVFVWMAGFNESGVPSWIWYKLGFYRSTFDQVSSTIIFAIVLVMIANTFGQVPVTIVVLDQLEPCLNQKRMILYLAWVVSLAGNMTLYSSAANIVVSHHSLRLLNYPLTLWNFLRFGIPVALLLIAVGLVIISSLLMIV